MSLPELEGFRRQLRDLYVPSGDVGFWQAAIRDQSDPLYLDLVDAIENRRCSLCCTATRRGDSAP